MLIIDLINRGETLENAYTVLERNEEQIRRRYEASYGFRLSMMVYSVVVNWKTLMPLTSCTDPFEFFEHRFNMTEYTGRKYYRLANILREYRYLLRGIDYKQIRSVHMMDDFKRALENHPQQTVLRALTTMSVREFERFSYRRPLYNPSEQQVESLCHDRPESNRTAVYFDYSRYHDVLTDAFEADKEILAIGTESQERWASILSILEREGFEMSYFEGQSPHESATITRRKPLLS